MGWSLSRFFDSLMCLMATSTQFTPQNTCEAKLDESNSDLFAKFARRTWEYRSTLDPLRYFRRWTDNSRDEPLPLNLLNRECEQPMKYPASHFWKLAAEQFTQILLMMLSRSLSQIASNFERRFALSLHVRSNSPKSWEFLHPLLRSIRVSFRCVNDTFHSTECQSLWASWS
jgi:hypothetical protein